MALCRGGELKISGIYSYKGGEKFIKRTYPDLLTEIEKIIASIDAESCRLKSPKDKEIARARRAGIKRFFSPPHMNALFDWHFYRQEWDLKPRINTHDPTRLGYREIDVVKEGLGVELQFGKYSFLTYDIIAKMVIFKNLGVIDAGVEICVMASMLPHMSSGIGAFEQVIWDLQTRGVADIDIPVLVLGIESEEFAATRFKKSGGKQKQTSLPDIQYEPAVVMNRTQHLNPQMLAKVRETGKIVD